MFSEMSVCFPLASFPDYSQILSQLWREIWKDKIWEWPGNEASFPYTAATLQKQVGCGFFGYIPAGETVVMRGLVWY